MQVINMTWTWHEQVMNKSWKIQGVPKKMRLGFCLISQQPSAGFSNSFLLLKTEIHTQILNIKPFLWDLRGPRYLRNKMGFVTRQLYWTCIFFIFIFQEFWKMIKININWNVFIQLGQTMASQGTSGALSTSQGPFRSQSVSLESLQCCLDHYR